MTAPAWLKLGNRQRKLGRRRISLAVGAALLSACSESSPIEPGDTVVVTRLKGSISGSVRGTLSATEDGGAQPVISISASRDGEVSRFIWASYPNVIGSDAATFTFDGLVAGTWKLSIHEQHPWTAIFPGMQLSFDSSFTVTVLANQSVAIPEVMLRPVAPFLVIATETCPWAVSGPMTLHAWGNCDSGYWGGLDVQVDVNGIAGSPTAGIHQSFLIKQETWFAELRSLPPGEYEVSGTAKQRLTGAARTCQTGWQLVPWRAAVQRMRVDDGLAYTEFEFWCQK